MNSTHTRAARGAARAPALLADATWYGSLAAARDLGGRGVPVTLASDAVLAPARWSRHVRRTVRCPPTKHPAFLEWLLAFGERDPGHVLYPTSDDVAWAVAGAREALARSYRLYSPSREVLATLLDKGRLAEAARAAGVPIPETWIPQDEAEVERIARSARFPLFVKARTQLMGTSGLKGDRVERREDLLRVWRAASMSPEQQARLGPEMAGSGGAIIQECYPENERIYTVDGFVTRGGEMVALACNKRLQRPRRRGPGIIFDHAPLEAALAAALQRLWRAVGFHGVFDVEFVVDGDRLMLIDLNPRFYNHMAYEIDRGLPLPWLAYLAAAGEEEVLAGELRAAREATVDPRRVYVHRLPVALTLWLQGLTGDMPRDQRRAWRRFLADRRGRVTDPASVPGDRWPALLDLVFQAATFLRHPRSFLLQLARDVRVPSAGPGEAPQRATAGVQERRAIQETPRSVA